MGPEGREQAMGAGMEAGSRVSKASQEGGGGRRGR